MKSGGIERWNRLKKETQSFLDGCSRMLLTASNMGSWMESSKLYINSLRRLDMLNDLINQELLQKSDDSCHDLADKGDMASLKIQALRLPLLWNEEIRRKFTGPLYVFFTVEHHDTIYDTTVEEIDPSKAQLYVPFIKILDVSVASVLKITCYYLWNNFSLHSKMPYKLKDVGPSDVCLKFQRMGSSIIYVKDILCTQTPIYCFEFECNDDREEQPVRSNTSSSVGMITAITNRRNTNSVTPASFFGTFLLPWKIASATFLFLPQILELSEVKFIANISGARNEEGVCAIFEGPNLCLYDSLRTYMHKPYSNHPVLEVDIMVETCLANDAGVSHAAVKLCDASNRDKLLATINFTSFDAALVFKKYFTQYKRCLNVWGSSIDVTMNEKSVVQIIVEIVENPSNIPKYL